MHIVVVGLNYRTAPVEVRERFTFAEKDLSEALQQAQADQECIGRCNRSHM